MELKLPVLGENITQGTVTKILVKVGDNITKGQNILELETDKAVLEVPSPDAGTVSAILVKEGQTVKVGAPVFQLGGAAQPAASAATSTPKASAPEAATPKAEPSSAKQSAPAAQPAASKPGPSVSAETAVASGEPVDLLLPVLGENIQKGTITKILVKAGDNVAKGQNILEVETDKAVLEVPSPSDFVIKSILKKEGDVVNIGAPIMKVQMTKAALESAAPKKSAAQAPTSAPAAKQAAASAAAPAPSSAPVATAQPGRNVAAAPSVRMFAREIGIDITLVTGSGSGGRISIDDVKKYSKALNLARGSGMPAAGPVVVPLPDFNKFGTVKREAMNNVRKKTAEHLSNAWGSIPHVTQCDKADVTEIEKLRKGFGGDKRKLSITPFIIKIIARALKQFPQFNASVDMASSEIVYKSYVNVGVAVDTERGLLVPVLKNVDQKGILQINDELTAIAERARTRKTTIEEMSGGSFTLSNLGGIGGTYFTPIVNWPEVAILGVSRGVMEPVYKDSQFVPRLMLPLSLSYDHRLIDGADGARFIRFIVEQIEKPDFPAES